MRNFIVRWLLRGLSLVLLLSVLGVAAFVGGFVLLKGIVHKPEVMVPTVLGLPEAEAIRELIQAGLAIHPEIETQESDQFEDGLVIEQSPRPNIMVKEGRRIRLTVSSGARRIIIPDLVGREEDEGLSVLQHVDLDIRQRAAIYHESVKPGLIIAQSPPPGEALLYGKAVSILVSLGPKPKAYVMPNRIGRAIDDVKREFEEMGFSAAVDFQEVPDPEDWGRILDQDPRHGSRLPEGGDVVFTVGVRQVPSERVQQLEIPMPTSATGQFVTVAVYEISDGRTGNPQTFRVPVARAGGEGKISIPFKGKVIVEIYDGAIQGGRLLYTNRFEPQSGTAPQETREE